MYGVPNNLNTKQDWINAVEYAKYNGGTVELAGRLQALRNHTKIKVLKDGVTTPPEEQTEYDYGEIDDPGCEKVRLGFTDAEIDGLISTLKEDV